MSCRRGPYDPDKAAWHLKQAGLSEVNLELYASDAAGPEAIDTAQLMQASIDPVTGINVEVKRVPADGYWSDTWMKKPWVVTYWGSRPTADVIFTLAFSSTAKWNDGFWKNEKFDQLLVQARGETDFATRRQLYWDMQELVHNEGSVVIYTFPKLIDAHAQSVHGFVGDPSWDFGGARVIDRVWLEG